MTVATWEKDWGKMVEHGGFNTHANDTGNSAFFIILDGIKLKRIGIIKLCKGGGFCGLGVSGMELDEIGEHVEQKAWLGDIVSFVPIEKFMSLTAESLADDGAPFIQGRLEGTR